MLSGLNKPRKAAADFILVFLYSCLSIFYFSILDPKYYIKNILNTGVAFVVPLAYIILVGLFVLCYCRLLKHKISDILYPVIAMAAILPLFYLLVDMKIGMRLVNPFGYNRGIFGIYGVAYFFLFISFFSLVTGVIFRGFLKKRANEMPEYDDLKAQRLIFHLPILVYFLYAVTTLLSNDFGEYAIYALLLFVLALSFEKVSVILIKIKSILTRFVKNEKLFLAALFITAFLIRYFWGARLLGIVGDNFIMASDDGICYDKFAAILAGGHLLPREGIYAVSGFGYWYFLGAIYKIFGLQNFTAVFTVQSFIGALIPVMVYFTAKMIFKTRFVPVLAGIMTSLDMTLVFLSVVIGMEAIYIPLVVFSMAYAVYLLHKRIINYKNAFVLGAILGLAYNARPPELLPFSLLLGALIYFVMRKILRMKKMIVVIASFFTGFIILISVQYINNYVQYNMPPILPSAAVESFRGDHRTNENTILGQMGFRPFEDFGRTLSVSLHHPFIVSGLIVKGFFKRLFFLYFLPNFGTFDPVYLVNPASGYFFRFPIYMQMYGCLLIAAGILTALIKKINPAGIAVLLLFLFYLSARPAFFFVLNCRYRGVLMPIFILFLSYGLELFYKKVKEAYAGKT